MTLCLIQQKDSSDCRCLKHSPEDDRIPSGHQEVDLETHNFSQGSWLSRASSSASTVSMTTTRSDAWPRIGALAGPEKQCVGWRDGEGQNTFY